MQLRPLSFTVLFILSVIDGIAQPSICEEPVDMTPFCNEACIICDIDGFTGRHDSDVRGATPPDFCVFGTENAQWIAFLAGSTNLTVDISVDNCDNGFLFSGLQVGMYESLDCETFTRVSNCIGFLFPIRDGQTRRLTTFDNLTIGQYYYIVMDGASGDNCDWTINVIDGTTEVLPLVTGSSVAVDSIVCVSDTVIFDLDVEVGATRFVWEIDSTVVSKDQVWDTVFAVSGKYEICVTGSNVCNEGPRLCDSITVLPLVVDTLAIDLCEGKCYSTSDTTICQPGAFDIIVNSAVACDTARHLLITSIPQLQLTIDTVLCTGGCLVLYDTIICEAGDYMILRDGLQACDTSIVIRVVDSGPVEVVVYDTICVADCFAGLDTVVCGQDSFTVYRPGFLTCDTMFTVYLDFLDTALVSVDTLLCVGDTLALDGQFFFEDQVYRQIRTTSEGCDSTISYDIQFLPLSVIDSTVILCPGDSFATSDTILTQGGSYELTLPSITSCDTILFLELDFFEVSDIIVDTSICPGEVITVMGIDILQPGAVTFDTTTSDGCNQQVMITTTEIEIPRVSLVDTLCVGDMYVVGDSVFFSSFQGDVTLTAGRCDSIVDVDLLFVECDIVVVDTVISQATCVDSTAGYVEIFYDGGLPPYSVSLVSVDGSVSIEASTIDPVILFEGLQAGTYLVQIVDALDNNSALTIVIPQEQVPELSVISSDYSGYQVSCADAQDGIITLNATGQITTFLLDGIPVVNPITDLPPGNYEVAAVSTSGCTSTSNVVLTAPSMLSLDYDLELENCPADTVGQVSISVVSELPIVDVRLNGQVVDGDRSPLLSGSGQYTIRAVDANSCEITDSFDVTEVVLPQVTYPDTITATLGDTITLRAGSDDIDSYSVGYFGLSSCDNCAEIEVQASASGLLLITSITSTGCQLIDTVMIVVKDPPPIVLSNVFSPNGDNLHDMWLPIHPSMRRLLRVSIYDRWGQIVHDVESPSSDYQGWDGLLNGSAVSDGIYVYMIEYVSGLASTPLVKTGTLQVLK